MKKIVSPAIAFTIFIFCFTYSCKKEEILPDKQQEGKLEFSIKLSGNSLNGKLKSVGNEVPNLHSVIVSIKDINDQIQYEREEISLLNMNGYYISKPLSLTIGDYYLTEFLVLDDQNNVIYISPKEGSPRAYLVDDPLPLEFNIEKDRVTKLVPEVISTVNGTPADYGYNTFSFTVVETFDFLAGIFVYADSIKNFSLTEAKLRVSSAGKELYCEDLEAITNQITLRDNFENYTIEVSKSGYLPYKQTFSADTLKTYISDEAGPLTIILEKRSLDIKNGSIILWWNGRDEKFGALDIDAEQVFTIGKVGNLKWWSLSGPCVVIDNILYAIGMNAESNSQNKKLYSCDVQTGSFLNEQDIESLNYSVAGSYNDQIVIVWWGTDSEKFGLLNPVSGDVTTLGDVGTMKFWHASSPCAVIKNKLVVFGVEDDKFFSYPHKAYVCDLESGEYIKKLSVPVNDVAVAGSYDGKLVLVWKAGARFKFGLLDIETGDLEELGIVENMKSRYPSSPCSVIEDKLAVIGYPDQNYENSTQQVYVVSLESGDYIKTFDFGGRNCAFAW